MKRILLTPELLTTTASVRRAVTTFRVATIGRNQCVIIALAWWTLLGVAQQETTYSAADGDCRITWTTSDTELNRGVVRHHPSCELPLARQAPLIAQLLPRVGPFHTLSWGRLFPDGPRDSTMAIRLALAAKRSPLWDSAKGRPRTGDINAFARKLSNDAAIYDELRPVFRQAGLSIELSSVEKVLVLPAAQLPFYEQLCREGVRPRDRLPFDFQTWFAIRPIR